MRHILHICKAGILTLVRRAMDGWKKLKEQKATAFPSENVEKHSTVYGTEVTQPKTGAP